MTAASQALTSEQIISQISSISGWTAVNKSGSSEIACIAQDYNFPDFNQAFAFVTRIALLAEASGHHPDIDIRYNQVRLALVSHDAGGVTNRDIHMAAKINELK